jgi:hypothetical protein
MNNQPEKILYVIIGCDVDPDRSYVVKNISTDRLSWRGMLEGIPRSRERFKNLLDSDGKQPIVVWLMRVDFQIKVEMGSYNGVLVEHKDFLENLERDGDEIGWHPHFWKYDEEKSVWFQNYYDTDWQKNMLHEAHAAFMEIFPGRAKTARTGWTYHNNVTIQTFGELGVEVDISAFPGMKIPADNKQRAISNFYDWYNTPIEPYYPSTEDYRRPATNNEQSCKVLEIPNLTAKSLFWGLVSGLVLTKKTGNPRQLGFSIKKPRLFPSITASPKLFKPLLSTIRNILTHKNQLVYATGLHADELIENTHPAYSLENMAGNIESLLKLAGRLNVKLKFVRGCDIKNYINDSIV